PRRATILFVGHQGKNQSAATRRAGPGQGRQRVDHRGYRALHVGGTQTIEALALDLAAEWVARPGSPIAYRLRVKVRVQDQGRPSGGSGQPIEQVGMLR